MRLVRSAECADILSDCAKRIWRRNALRALRSFANGYRGIETHCAANEGAQKDWRDPLTLWRPLHIEAGVSWSNVGLGTGGRQNSLFDLG